MSLSGISARKMGNASEKQNVKETRCAHVIFGALMLTLICGAVLFVLFNRQYVDCEYDRSDINQLLNSLKNSIKATEEGEGKVIGGKVSNALSFGFRDEGDQKWPHWPIPSIERIRKATGASPHRHGRKRKTKDDAFSGDCKYNGRTLCTLCMLMK